MIRRVSGSVVSELGSRSLTIAGMQTIQDWTVWMQLLVRLQKDSKYLLSHRVKWPVRFKASHKLSKEHQKSNGQTILTEKLMEDKLKFVISIQKQTRCQNQLPFRERWKLLGPPVNILILVCWSKPSYKWNRSMNRDSVGLLMQSQHLLLNPCLMRKSWVPSKERQSESRPPHTQTLSPPRTAQLSHLVQVLDSARKLNLSPRLQECKLLVKCSLDLRSSIRLENVWVAINLKWLLKAQVMKTTSLRAKMKMDVPTSNSWLHLLTIWHSIQTPKGIKLNAEPN
jgi:hypothetical protein